MMSSPTAMHDAVEQIAKDAAGIALRHFRDLSRVPVEAKGHLDLVTAADREVEAFIVGELRRLFPADGIVGEEGSSVLGSAHGTTLTGGTDGVAASPVGIPRGRRVPLGWCGWRATPKDL